MYNSNELPTRQCHKRQVANTIARHSSFMAQQFFSVPEVVWLPQQMMHYFPSWTCNRMAPNPSFKVSVQRQKDRSKFMKAAMGSVCRLSCRVSKVFCQSSFHSHVASFCSMLFSVIAMVENLGTFWVEVIWILSANNSDSS